MSLEQWRLNHWLKETEPKLPEIAQLFAVVEREIKDASIAEISVDGRFMHAYDAALNLCTIALRASGYSVMKGQGHHKRTIESLGKRVSRNADQVDLASRLRGQAMYDRAGVVEDVDASELLQTANALREAVIDWLKTSHPYLLPEHLRKD